MTPARAPRIALFPALRVEVDGRDVTAALSGRQGRLLLAYLASHWPEPVSRDVLADVVWPDSRPGDPEAGLRTVLSRVRKVLWPGAIRHGDPLMLQLPDDAHLDSRDALAQLEAAQTALASDPTEAGTLARGAAATLLSPFLSGLQGDWFEERRRHFEAELPTALELIAQAGLALGGEHLAAAERAARELVAREPYGERHYRLLMQIQAARGDVAEALRTYDGLRTLLWDELGHVPSASVMELHTRLLGAPAAAPEPPAIGLPPVTPRIGSGAFVGRESVLTQLREAWAEAARGPASAVFVAGPAGIGKTRLTARFAEGVHGAGATVLYGRADEDALIPFQPFVEALRALAGDAGDERGILSRLLPGLGAPSDEAEDQTGRYRLFEAVAALLMRTARRRPTLVVLDDLHWADQPTFALLRHLLRHPDLERVFVIGTFRAAEGQLAHFLTALRRERRYQRLELTGLDLEATAALLDDRLGAEAAPGLVRRLHEQTGGNAFFIEETVHALLDAGERAPDEQTLERLGVPDGVAAVILGHVDRLSPLSAELLSGAAVVGRDFTLPVVERLVEAGGDAVIAALEEALASRLILETGEPDAFTFAHAVVREALYHRLAGMRRTRLHLRVAEALEAGSAVNPAELAHHYSLACHLAGPEPARRYSTLAGRRAADVFAYEEAVAHYRRALELVEDEAERCELLLALGRVQYHGADSGARDTFLAAVESARERGAAEQFARATLGLGERFWETAYVGSRSRDLLQEAATLLGPAPGPLRALVLARLAENLAFPVHHERASALSAEALAIARGLDDEDVLIQALLARHVTRLDIDSLDERLALTDELLARAGDHLELVAERHQWRLYDLLEAGDVAAARSDHARLEALAAELRQPLFQTLAVGWRGVLAELSGEVVLAESCADECRRFAERAHARDSQSTWAAKMFMLCRRAGRLGELEEITEELARERRPGWLPALGILRAELGDRAAAERILSEALADEPHRPGMFRLVTLALIADLCALLGRPAPDLYDALTPYSHRCVMIAYSSFWGPVDRFLAMLAETLGDRALAQRHANAALERSRALGAPVLVADIEQRHPELLRG